MNKQEMIDKAVIETKGKWPSLSASCIYLEKFLSVNVWACSSSSLDAICSKDEFNQRAKELGYINGYQWGVEYPTNGVKPDLPDDVVVYARNFGDECGKGDHVKDFFWNDYFKFKVVDDRYKPADISYLDKPEPQSVSEKPESKREVGNVSEKPAPKHINPKITFDQIEFLSMSEEFYKLSEPMRTALTPAFNGWVSTRKAEAEKRRVVDAAAKKFHASVMPDYSGQPFLDGLSALYDAGFLRLPPGKN